MSIEVPPPFESLTYLSPMSTARAERLARFAAGEGETLVLDLGCGWAELLLTAVESNPSARGIGIDLAEASIEEGRARARRRGIDDRVHLVAGDAAAEAPEQVDAVVCVGASQIWASSATPGPLDYAAALRAIRARLPHGGRAVYGEGIWAVPPTTEATTALGGGSDELVTVAELVAAASANGFAVIEVGEADLAEWDAFESGFVAGHARWLAEHPGHPEAADVRDRLASRWAAYLGGYRGVMGMAYLSMVAV